jgi:hypothetical protein
VAAAMPPTPRNLAAEMAAPASPGLARTRQDRGLLAGYLLPAGLPAPGRLPLRTPNGAPAAVLRPALDSFTIASM